MEVIVPKSSICCCHELNAPLHQIGKLKKQHPSLYMCVCVCVCVYITLSNSLCFVVVQLLSHV